MNAMVVYGNMTAKINLIFYLVTQCHLIKDNSKLEYISIFFSVAIKKRNIVHRNEK